ncbi:MAG: OB-fold nucleic acid binding domain-containing protein, partial [Candidatus Thermoplasmatota archaeon]|nr:OB-fold nucleic acid binding domain-containing protein [Candidatus Thermoplasmatota archaeon]
MTKDTWIGDVRAGKHDGSEVELKGWVHRTRGSNKIRFVVLRDSTGTVQCVVKRDIVGDETFEAVKEALIESSLIFRGTAEPTDREHGHEIQVSSAEIVGPVNPEQPFPITES